MAGTLFFLGAALWIVARRDAYGGHPVGQAIFALEAATYLLIAAGYARRSAAYERATRAVEVLPPLLGAVLPFAFQLEPYRPPRELELALALAMLAGNAIAVAGYASLGPSFAITVEARPLRAGGPYRFVRHPVYLGQMVTFAAVATARVSWRSALVYLCFVAVQVLRAVVEERKLERASPGYAEYKKRTAMFIPLVV